MRNTKHVLRMKRLFWDTQSGINRKSFFSKTNFHARLFYFVRLFVKNGQYYSVSARKDITLQWSEFISQLLFSLYPPSFFILNTVYVALTFNIVFMT